MTDKYPYIWRVKTRLPERKGTRCNVLVRGGMNSCLVEFEDGYKVITSRNYLRKAPESRTRYYVDPSIKQQADGQWWLVKGKL